MEKPEKQKKNTPEQKHRQQFWLEILLPLLVVVLVVLALTTLALTLTGPNATILSQWADISLIVLIVPVLLGCLIVGIIVLLLNRLMRHINQSLPPIAFLVRSKVDLWAGKIQKIATVPAVPVIKINSFFAGMKQFFSSLRER